MTEIATAYISVVPEVNKGIQQAYSEAAKGGKRIGEALGSGISTGASAGLQSLQAKAQATAGAVQKSSRDVAAAHKAEADAAGALRVAQIKLNEARDSGNIKTSSLVAAEERVAKAQRVSEATSRSARDAVERHEAATRRAETATKSFADAQDGTSKRVRTVGDAYASSSRSIGDSADKVGGFTNHVSGFAVALSRAAAVGIAAVGAMAAGGVALGIKTAASMEQAQISFETMLGSAEKAQVFLKKLADFAAATPFEFPELQTAASSLISAGINADKVIPIMKTLGNATSGMGTGSEGIKRATVALQQMNAAGKITGEDLNQLRDAGIPVYDLLAAATGKSKEAVTELASAGELGRKELEQLMTALESGKGLERFNGLMEKQSQSLTGLWSTFKDTMQMGLANAITPLLPIFKELIAGASSFASDVMPKVGEVLARVGTIIAGLFKLIVGGDFTGAFAEALGISEDSSIVDNILSIRDAIAGLFTFITTGDFTQGFVNAIGVQEGGPVIEALITIRQAVIDLAKTIAEKLSGAFSWASEHLSTVVALGAALVAIITAFKIGALITAAWTIGTTAYGIAATFAATQTSIWAGAMNLLKVAFLTNPIGWIIVGIIALVAAVIYAWNNFETFRNVVIAVWEAIKTAVGTVISWFQMTVWPILQTVFEWIGEKVTWLWENIFSPVWREISLVVGEFVALLMAYVWPIIDTVFKWIGDRVTWLWQNIIQPAFTIIQAIIGAFVWFIQNILWPVFLIVFTLIANTVTWLWQSIIAPAFQNIGAIIAFAWNNVIKPILESLKWFFENVLAPVFGWLWHNVIEPFLEGIADRFRTGVAIIGTIWNGLKALAKAPIDFIVNTVINGGLIKGINWVAEKLGLKDKINVSPIPWPPEGWSGGGWTGPGAKYQPAGVVHADEYVIRKSSRRRIESKMPGFLDALNQRGDAALGYAGGGKVRPVPGGFTTYAGHTGVDFPVASGTSVRAFMDGVVETVRAMATSYGTYVMMNHGGGLQSIYAHLQQATVQPGQTVISGDQVGLSDSTGNSSGPHLHFELRQDGQWFDPAGVLNGTQAISGGPLSNLKEIVVNYLRDNVKNLLDKVPGEGGFFRDVAIGGAKKLIDTVADFLIGKAEATDANNGAALPSNLGSNQATAAAMLATYGWGPDQMGALATLWDHESGWNASAKNPSSGAYGIPQALPASKMASAGGDWQTNPATQIKWGLGYIAERYGSPSAALAFWNSHNWYAEGGRVEAEPLLFDKGGMLPTGISLVENRTGAPEPLARMGAGGMTGLRIEGTLDTPWGPSQLRGLVQSEIRNEARELSYGAA